MPANSLWTPDRDIPLGINKSESVSAREMRVLEDLDGIAQRLNLELRCGRCGKPFHGLNDGHARTQAIFCGCREIKAVVGGSVVGL